MISIGFADVLYGFEENPEVFVYCCDILKYNTKEIVYSLIHPSIYSHIFRVPMIYKPVEDTKINIF